MNKNEILEILEENNCQQDGLIATLTAIQEKFGYLPEIVLRTISEQIGRSLIDIYGVASFYKAFSLTPRGKNIIKVCLGTACHVRGAVPILEEIERKLDIRPGETTEDILAHLAVAFGCSVIKTGITGGERLAKLNELLRISEQLREN